MKTIIMKLLILFVFPTFAVAGSGDQLLFFKEQTSENYRDIEVKMIDYRKMVVSQSGELSALEKSKNCDIALIAYKSNVKQFQDMGVDEVYELPEESYEELMAFERVLYDQVLAKINMPGVAQHDYNLLTRTGTYLLKNCDETVEYVEYTSDKICIEPLSQEPDVICMRDVESYE